MIRKGIKVENKDFKLIYLADNLTCSLHHKKSDVIHLVNLPTGSGKSLIYQALPIVFDSIFKEQGHIVNYIPATDEIHMEDQNHDLAWTKPNSDIYNTQHSQRTCALRVKLKSCGSRTIKGERTLCTELQKFSSIR